MRILWVNVGGLWPLTTGGRQRSFHMISEMARRHRVTLLTTHGPDDDPRELANRLSHCEEVISVPHALPKRDSMHFAISLVQSWFSRLPVILWRWRVPALRKKVERILAGQEVDLCVVDFLHSAPNIVLGGRVPVVLFAHNVEHVIWQRLKEIENRRIRRALLEFEWRKMRRFEGEVCSRCSLTIAVSERDRDLLAPMTLGAPVAAIPTGVDTSYFSPNGTPEAAHALVFSGSMDWYPNEDAVLYFMDEILPLIRREIPQATLTVAGRNPSPRLREEASKAGVGVTGTVEDVRPYLDGAQVYVVPLRVGGGTRLKIFEALAMGKAVVSTSVGAEGLPLVPGKHFLQADDPLEFARAVVSLLRDPVRRSSLGKAGRELVESCYSWPQVAREFEIQCQEVLAHAC